MKLLTATASKALIRLAETCMLSDSPLEDLYCLCNDGQYGSGSSRQERLYLSEEDSKSLEEVLYLAIRDRTSKEVGKFRNLHIPRLDRQGWKNERFLRAMNRTLEECCVV